MTDSAPPPVPELPIRRFCENDVVVVAFALRSLLLEAVESPCDSVNDRITEFVQACDQPTALKAGDVDE
jgi:hypothetical protein